MARARLYRSDRARQSSARRRRRAWGRIMQARAMSERLPLHDAHERLGARFTEAAGTLVPKDYGDADGEHEAVRERAGLIDRSERGKIEVTGKDRATFLHGLVSSDVKGLAPGQGSESALLDVHGKVTALLAVHCLPDRLILETDRELAGPLLTGIDRYLFSERAELEDVTPASGILTVAGPLARKTVEQALGGPVPDLARWHHVVLPWDGAEVRVVRTEETGEEGYDLWAPSALLGRLWDRLREAGARPVGRDGLERAPGGSRRRPLRRRRGCRNAPPGSAASRLLLPQQGLLPRPGGRGAHHVPGSREPEDRRASGSPTQGCPPPARRSWSRGKRSAGSRAPCARRPFASRSPSDSSDASITSRGRASRCGTATSRSRPRSRRCPSTAGAPSA